MVNINKESIEMDGRAPDLLAELASGMAYLAEQTDRTFVISMFLSSFYMLQKEKYGNSTIEALEMFKADTKRALELIDQYCSLNGNTLDEKYDNMKGENNE